MKIFIKIIIFLCITSVLNIQKISAEEKIKIGLLVPLTGQNSEIGKSIIKSGKKIYTSSKLKIHHLI